MIGAGLLPLERLEQAELEVLVLVHLREKAETAIV